MLNSPNIEINPNCTSGQFTRIVFKLTKLQTMTKNEGWRGGEGGVIVRWDVIT